MRTILLLLTFAIIPVLINGDCKPPTTEFRWSNCLPNSSVIFNNITLSPYPLGAEAYYSKFYLSYMVLDGKNHAKINQSLSSIKWYGMLKGICGWHDLDLPCGNCTPFYCDPSHQPDCPLSFIGDGKQHDNEQMLFWDELTYSLSRCNGQIYTEYQILLTDMNTNLTVGCVQLDFLRVPQPPPFDPISEQASVGTRKLF